MNEKEFKQLLAQVEFLNAEQFQKLAETMGSQAANTAAYSQDKAWSDAHGYLAHAAVAISHRKGN